LQSKNKKRIEDTLEKLDSGEYAPSKEAEIKKIIPKIEEKAEQLPADGPGLIIIDTPICLKPGSSKETFRKALEPLLEKQPHVSAVVLLESFYDTSVGISLINTFSNPKAKVDISNSKTMQTIKSFGVRKNC
jgi:hypothetical protein